MPADTTETTQKSQSDQLEGGTKIEKVLDSIPEEHTFDYPPNQECVSSSLNDNLIDKEPIKESLKRTNVQMFMINYFHQRSYEKILAKR